MKNDGKLWWIALGALWGSFNRLGEERDVANKLRSLMSITPRVLDWVASVYSTSPVRHGEWSSSVLVLPSKRCVWDIWAGTELKSNTIQCLDQILVCSQHVFSLKITNKILMWKGIMISIVIQLMFVMACVIPTFYEQRNRGSELKSVSYPRLDYRSRICSFKFCSLSIRSILHCLK